MQVGTNIERGRLGMDGDKIGGSNTSSVKGSLSKGHTQASSPGGFCVGAVPKLHIL